MNENQSIDRSIDPFFFSNSLGYVTFPRWLIRSLVPVSNSIHHENLRNVPQNISIRTTSGSSLTPKLILTQYSTIPFHKLNTLITQNIQNDIHDKVAIHRICQEQVVRPASIRRKLLDPRSIFDLSRLRWTVSFYSVLCMIPNRYRLFLFQTTKGTAIVCLV